MKSSLLLAMGLFLACGFIQADDSAPANASGTDGDYNQIIAHFFDLVKASKFNDAAHVLVDTNEQDAFNVEKHEALAVPMQKISDNFGTFKEFKPIVAQTMGDAIGYVYGVGIYEKTAVRFEFMFFKDGNRWRMLHIDFSLNFADEIRAMAGVHFPVAPVATSSPASTPSAPVPTTPTPTPNASPNP